MPSPLIAPADPASIAPESLPEPGPETPRLVPVAEIDPKALLRDRASHDEAAQKELVSSISRHGLRAPIEIFSLANPRPPYRYGLVSGFRRLAAWKTIRDYTEIETYDRIPAWIREAETDVDLLTRMVEENDVRAGLSSWEKAAVAVRAFHWGCFPNIEDAVTGLYQGAAPMKLTRLRAIARAVEHFDMRFPEPWRLSERQCLRIAAAIEIENFGDVLDAALDGSHAQNFEGAWAVIEPVLLESEALARPDAPKRPEYNGRPRRVVQPRRGLTIRREKTRDGYRLHFSSATELDGLVEDIMDEVERRYGG